MGKGEKMKNKKSLSNRHSLSMLALAMMSIACVLNLRGFPMMAEEGLAMIFFILFAAILFLLPLSLVSAELGSGWPQGGVYRWVKEAFGSRWGFFAIWLQWIQNVVWYPTLLAFTAAALAYLFLHPALAENHIFYIIVILAVYWGATFVTCRGMKAAGRLSTIGIIAGMLIPAVLLIVLGILWIATGNPVDFMKTSSDFLPDFSNFDKVALLAGITLLFAGMEVNAVHITEMKDPKREYPKAIFIAMAIIIVVLILGSVAVGAAVPEAKLSLTAGTMEGFDNLLSRFHIHWLLPVMGLLVTFGALANVTAWVAGPSRGLLIAAKEGKLPPFLQHTNKYGMQTHILLIQGVIVSVLSVVYFVMPTVSSAFFILSALAMLLYAIMYGLLFAAAIKLRYSQPDAERAYKVPGDKLGIWLVSMVGLIAILFTFIVGFLPPSQLTIGSPTFYVTFLIAGVIILAAAPLVIHKLRKPSWVPAPASQEEDEESDESPSGKF